MNNDRDTVTNSNSSWECIDPGVGHCLWELEAEETSEARTRQLQAHLELCDACRLGEALNTRLEKDLEAGTILLPETPVRPWWLRPAVQASAGSALIAACVALLMILPPAPTCDTVLMRGPLDVPHFLRPVEGEVVLPEGTELSWAPVKGATSYKVTVTDMAGDYHWIGSTQTTQLKLPLQNQGRQILRAVLATVPADLVSNGSVSVSFCTGSRLQLVRDRLIKAPFWLAAFWAGGFSLLGLSLYTRTRKTGTA